MDIFTEYVISSLNMWNSDITENIVTCKHRKYRCLDVTMYSVMPERHMFSEYVTYSVNISHIQ